MDVRTMRPELESVLRKAFRSENFLPNTPSTIPSYTPEHSQVENACYKFILNLLLLSML